MVTDQDTEIEISGQGQTDMPIIYCGMDREPPHPMVFRTAIDDKWSWFTGEIKWLPDGSRFELEIQYFGFAARELAGSTEKSFGANSRRQMRRQFTIG